MRFVEQDERKDTRLVEVIQGDSNQTVAAEQIFFELVFLVILAGVGSSCYFFGTIQSAFLAISPNVDLSYLSLVQIVSMFLYWSSLGGMSQEKPAF